MRRSRQRSVYCTPVEKAMIRERAAQAKRPVSRFLVECALEGKPDDHGRYRLVLSEGEQRQLGEWGAQLARIVETMLHGVPGTDISMVEAISVLHHMCGAAARGEER